MKMQQSHMTYWQRLRISLLVWASFAYTFVFFGPLEIIAFSADSFDYSYLSATLPLLITALLVVGILAPLCALLREKAFDICITVLFGFLICSYLQALFFNGKLGLLTGDAILWQNMTLQITINLIVWLFLIADLFVLLFLKRDWWKNTLLFVSAALIVMQLAPTVAIFTGQYDVQQEEKVTHLTTEGMYEFSSENNTLIFVLDRLDYDYIETVLGKDSTLLDGLDGFTCYREAISAQARTSPALNHLLTNAWEMAYTMPRAEYYEKSWNAHGESILASLHRAGYDIGLYAKYGDLFSRGSSQEPYVSNLSRTEKAFNYPVLVDRLLRLSAFRYAPLILKECFWMDTNSLNTGVFQKTATIYEINDVPNYQGFQNSVLSEQNRPAVKLYHFNGTHAPFYMNADGTQSLVQTDLVSQTKGTFHHLYTVFQKMKELGIYKDATIIITGDHADPISDSLPLQKATRTGIFYKPAGSADTPLVFSDAPVATGNIPATILKSAGLDYSAFGDALDDIAEDAKITRYYQKTVHEIKTYHEIEVYLYQIIGKASNFENWKILQVNKIESGHNFY